MAKNFYITIKPDLQTGGSAEVEWPWNIGGGGSDTLENICRDASAYRDFHATGDDELRAIAVQLAKALSANWNYLRDGDSADVRLARGALDLAQAKGLLR